MIEHPVAWIAVALVCAGIAVASSIRYGPDQHRTHTDHGDGSDDEPEVRADGGHTGPARIGLVVIDPRTRDRRCDAYEDYWMREFQVPDDEPAPDELDVTHDINRTAFTDGDGASVSARYAFTETLEEVR